MHRMVFAEDIRKTILTMASEHGPDKGFRPADVARRVDAQNWQSLIEQVSFVAAVLEKEGKIRSTRIGGEIDFITTTSQNGYKANPSARW
jgi:hypothetical protein